MFNLILIFLISFVFTTSAHAGLQDGLVGWWKFDEASGNAVDSSGLGHTGTPVGTTIVANCKRSGCRSFNGTSDYIAGPIPVGISATTGTVSFWIFASPGNNTFFAMPGATRLYSYSDNGTIYLGLGGNGSINTGATITNNVWINYVLTYNSGNWNLYKNAVSSGSSTYTGSIPTNQVFNIAGSPAYLGYYMGGRMDDVRLYNRVLTIQEIADLYKPGIRLSTGSVSTGKMNQ